MRTTTLEIPWIAASAVLFLACTRAPASSSTTQGAASSVGSTSTPTSTPDRTNDEWAASDARKPALLPDMDANTRAFVAERVVKVTPEDAPFLKDGHMFVIVRTGRMGEPTVNHPSFFHLLQLKGKGARGLHGDEDWEWLRAGSQLSLDTESNRVAYVSRYIDMLCSARTRYAWPVKTVDDLQLLTSADADAMPRAGTEAEAVKARALHEKYQGVIKPLTLAGGAGPWRGALFANGRHHLIVRVDVVLTADGKITLTDTVLEKDAPIPGVFP